jgi:hypothetical protein
MHLDNVPSPDFVHSSPARASPRYSWVTRGKGGRFGMTIKLDWRFGLIERLGDVHMKELMDFYRQAEEHFRVAMETWVAETTGLTEEQEAMDSDYLIEQRDRIESLMDRGHTLGIVALYSFLERFLNLVVEHLRSGGAPIPESKQGFGLHKLRDYLKEHAQIDLGRATVQLERT